MGERLERYLAYVMSTRICPWIILTYPTIWLAIGASKRWKATVSYTRLPDAMELPPLVIPGLRLMRIMSIIIPTIILATLVFTILAVCIANSASKPRTWTKVLLITFFATADLLQAGALLAALILQFSFLPPLLTRCKNYQGPAAIKHMFLHEATAKWMKKKEKERKGQGPNVYEVCKDYAEMAYIAVFIMSTLFVFAGLIILSPTEKAWKKFFGAIGWIFYKGLREVIRALRKIPPRFIFTGRIWKQWRQNAVAKITTTEPPSDSIELKILSKCDNRTCEPDSKKECWACAYQICGKCSVEITPNIPSTTNHLTYCEPRCPQCYFKRLCVKDLRKKICMDWKSEGLKDGTRKVCSECSQLPENGLAKLREAREEEEIMCLSRGQLKCGECHRKLPQRGSPRWWVCGKCNGECTSHLHSSWSRSPA